MHDDPAVARGSSDAVVRTHRRPCHDGVRGRLGCGHGGLRARRGPPRLGVAVDAIGWRAYAPLSLLLLAAGIRALSALPYSVWGVRAIALVEVADALRDAWLAWPGFASDSQAVPWVTVATIVVAGAVSTYLVAGPTSWRPSRRAGVGPARAER